jgi:hypothetical protein
MDLKASIHNTVKCTYVCMYALLWNLIDVVRIIGLEVMEDSYFIHFNLTSYT